MGTLSELCSMKVSLSISLNLTFQIGNTFANVLYMARWRYNLCNEQQVKHLHRLVKNDGFEYSNHTHNWMPLGRKSKSGKFTKISLEVWVYGVYKSKNKPHKALVFKAHVPKQKLHPHYFVSLSVDTLSPMQGGKLITSLIIGKAISSGFWQDLLQRFLMNGWGLFSWLLQTNVHLICNSLIGWFKTTHKVSLNLSFFPSCRIILEKIGNDKWNGSCSSTRAWGKR